MTNTNQTKAAAQCMPENSFATRHIAISVSESDELNGQAAIQNFKAAASAVAGLLIDKGVKITYGGDMRPGGFTLLFSEKLPKNNQANKRRFVNYFPYIQAKKLSLQDRNNLHEKQISTKILDVPHNLWLSYSQKNYRPLSNIDDRFVYAECYQDMRIQRALDCDGFIALGGRIKGYHGYYPGVLEETYYALLAGKPVYLIGGFGGVTKKIIEMMSGKLPEQLNNKYQFDSLFLRKFKKRVMERTGKDLSYDSMFDFFKNKGFLSLAIANGLTVKENETLFNSTNVPEILELINKGLQQISLV